MLILKFNCFFNCIADWCPPCKRIAPFYVTLSEKYGSSEKATFYKINCNSLSMMAPFYKKKCDALSAKAICKTYKVKAVPTFCFFNGGKYITSVVGEYEKQLEETIVSFLKK